MSRQHLVTHDAKEPPPAVPAALQPRRFSKQKLTREDMRAEAQAIATGIGAPVDIWEHVGGQTPKGRVAGTGRLMTRPASKPAPKWGCWRKVETVAP